MKNTLLALILFTLIISHSHSEKLLFDVDAASFKFDDEHTKWELYYSIPDSVLSYKFQNGRYVAELYMKIEVKSNLGVEDFKEWIVDYSVDSAKNNRLMNLVGQKDFYLKNGTQFEVSFHAKDLNDTLRTAQAKFNILTPKFKAKELSISDIELAQAIEPELNKTQNWNSAFLKNSLFVIPNPTLEIISDNPKLKCYSEIYNAKLAASEGVKIEYKVYNAVKKIATSYTRTRESISDGLVETITMPLDLQPSGVYYLNITAKFKNDDKEDSVTATKKFYLINPEMPPVELGTFAENITFEKSEFSTFSESQVNQEYDKMKYILIPYEVDLFASCKTLESKQRCLFRFWGNRDKDSTTPVNEYREEYRRRIDYANKYFSYGLMRDGWKTDRGRVLLQYGEPTQQDYITQDGELRAHIKWFYGNQQGGINFVFVDLSGFGNFILVHSDAIGEASNYNWYNEYVPPMNFDANKNLIDN